MYYLIHTLLWLRRALEESDGKASFKRILGAFLTIVFAVSYLKIAIPSQQLHDIPANWAMLIGAIILGMGYISKMKGN